jgi:hypothetical protein
LTTENGWAYLLRKIRVGTGQIIWHQALIRRTFYLNYRIPPRQCEALKRKLWGFAFYDVPFELLAYLVNGFTANK